jgi:hypothetical protein
VIKALKWAIKLALLNKKKYVSGRVYLYLGKREFVQCDGIIEPINGILYVQVYKRQKILYQ